MSRTLLALALLLISATGPTALAAEAPYDAATYQRLLASGAPFAVDFHADWCPTCRAQAPVLRSIAQSPQLSRVTLLIADYDKEGALKKSLHVTQQSTVVVFSHGKEVARSTGDTSEAGLTKLLRSALS
jgi:thiol-disulfide isomerase/thioredoxin